MSLSSEAIERLRSRGSVLLRSDTALLGVGMRRGVEEREYPRVAASLSARFMVDGGGDVEATLGEVSGTGFTLVTMHPVRSGQRIVADVHVIGRLEGVVVRLTADGFAVENHYSRQKRERLAATIDWLAQQDVEALKVRRRHERSRPRMPVTVVVVDELVHEALVLDSSRSGVAFASPASFEVGTVLNFGRNHPIRARVVRVWALDSGGQGHAAEFLRLLPPERVDPEDGF